MRDGFHFPWGATWLLPHLTVVVLQLVAFTVKVIFFLLVADPFALERAALSLRSGDAPRLENDAARGFTQRRGHGDRDRPGAIVQLWIFQHSYFSYWPVSLVLSSLLVVFLRNVVHCALALVSALLIIAILFVTLHAPMLGVLQVMVYAGAIMVLFCSSSCFSIPPVLERAGTLWWSTATVLAVLLGGLLVPLFFNNEVAGDPVASTEFFGSPEMLAKKPVQRFCSALRDRFGLIVGRDRRRGGAGETGARGPMMPLHYYLILSAVVFAIGVIGVLIRRNLIVVLMSIELMLNAVNLHFHRLLALSRFGGRASRGLLSWPWPPPKRSSASRSSSRYFASAKVSILRTCSYSNGNEQPRLGGLRSAALDPADPATCGGVQSFSGAAPWAGKPPARWPARRWVLRSF